MKYYTTKLNKKENNNNNNKLNAKWICHGFCIVENVFLVNHYQTKKVRQHQTVKNLFQKKKVISLICFDFTCSCFFLVVLVGLGRWNQQTALQVNIAGHHEQKINNHQSN